MKILILLMSCNKPLYEEEEKACRETFLKDVDETKVSYWFYKGINASHLEQEFDIETHTLYLIARDDLAGTGKKSLEAIRATLNLDYDYLIKTNVSTYLNIDKIVKEMETWEGKADENIYGGRFIVNEASKDIPFPRGYFMAISKSLAKEMLEVADRLVGKSGIPLTDDTLMGLSLLYVINKVKGKDYLSKLQEVPSVVEWPNYDISRAPEFADSLAIRCKVDKFEGENPTPDNMRLVHEKLSSPIKSPAYRPAQYFESGVGLFKYEKYHVIKKLIEKLKEEAKKKKDENTNV